MPPSDDARGGASEALAVALAAGSTRRSFLGRLGAWTLGVVGGRSVAAAVAPDEAEAYHFCGHIYTTGSCRSPYPLPRIDRRGLPLRPRDGHAIDNLGRPVDVRGFPLGPGGRRLRQPDGTLVPPAPRTRLCEDWVPEEFGIEARTQGAWYRCCGGQIRKLTDCCSTHPRRINGDRALRGYCRAPRTVFCVMYYDTGAPC